MILWLIGLCSAAEFHLVRSGETLEGIAAERDDVEVSLLRELNGLGDTDEVAAGTMLRLPDAAGGIYGAGVVVSLSGTGFVEGPGLPRETLKRGTRIEAGITVCTEANSFATVRLAVAIGGFAHDDLSLFPETCLSVESAVSRGDARSSVVNMSKGGVAVRNANSTPGEVTIRTSDGVTTGSMGGFRVHVEEASTRTEALYEPVAVIGVGQEVPVGAGQGNRVVEGEVPQEPVDLLPAVDLLLPVNEAVLRRPDFSWMEAERALGYRVEVAVRDDFSEIVYQDDIDRAEWHPELLFLPYRVPGLYWRVSSFDRTGFMGFPSEHRVLRFPDGVGP